MSFPTSSSDLWSVFSQQGYVIWDGVPPIQNLAKYQRSLRGYQNVFLKRLQGKIVYDEYRYQRSYQPEESLVDYVQTQVNALAYGLHPVSWHLLYSKPGGPD